MLATLHQTQSPSFAVETITPQKAAHYLSFNTSNRPLRKSWVSTIAKAMQRGEWTLNGEAIKFAVDGRLLDGQNRLHAIVRAGIPQQMLIARGLDPAVFETLDQGVKRTASDIFSISGEKNTSVLAAAARAIAAIENDGNFQLTFTVPQLREIIESHPNLREWVERHVGTKCQRFAPSSLPAVLSLGAEKRQAQAEDFMHLMATGEGMNAGHPVLLLRERLIESSTSSIKRLKPAVVAAYIVKSWNSFVTSKPLSLLRFNPGRDEFPEIK